MTFPNSESRKTFGPDLAGIVCSATIIFAAIYFTSLTFVYVEGDDATSVVHHAIGRVPWLQPPYSAYHGMMDIFLAWLPANEVVVRHVAMSITAAAALLMVILLLLLIREWLEPMSGLTSALMTLLLLACSPEIFYLGLVYTPSLAAMCFVLASHLMIRKSVEALWRPESSKLSFAATFLISAVLFGIGVACRWDVGIYLFFIAGDLILNLGTKGRLWRTSALAMAWVTAAFAMSLASIRLSGYGFAQIEATLALAREEVLRWDSWFALFGAYQTLFTPAFVFLFAAGMFLLLRNNFRLALLSILGLLPVIPFLFSREPKMILPALPGLWLAVATGVRFFLEYGGPREHRVRLAGVAIAVLALLPWLIGLQVESAETSWGPGFNIKTPVAREAHPASEGLISDQVNQRSVAVRRWNLTFTGGFAIPTPEGPRPLGGHLSVLLVGGEWRRLNSALDRERLTAIETAVDNNYSLMQDEGNSLITAKLLEQGYSTNDPKVDYNSAIATQRQFVNAEGRTLNLQLLRTRGSLFRPDDLRSLVSLNPSGKVVLFSGYSSTIRKLVEDAPEAATVQGPFSAVVDLGRLVKSVDK